MVISIMKCENASLNIDFIISMLFLIGVICSVVSIAEGRLVTLQDSAEAVEARSLSEKVIQAVDLTYSGGEGHEMRIEMPSDLKGSDYRVEVNQSGVLVKVEGKRCYSFSYLKRISNYDLKKFEVVMFPKRTYIIRNVKDSSNNHFIVIFEDS